MRTALYRSVTKLANIPKTYIRCRLDQFRRLTSNICDHPTPPPPTDSTRQQGMMQATYTCTNCNTRNAAHFAKLSYERGVVLARCKGCERLHLMADNLGWFSDSKINIEKLLREKGENVKKYSATVEINGPVNAEEYSKN